MKKIVVWLSASSRVSWLQEWKQMHLWQSMLFSTCWWWKETQQEVEKEGTQGAVAILKERKVQGCVSHNSDPKISMLRKGGELGLNASAGHTMKFLECTWYETKIPEKKGHLQALSKNVNPGFEEWTCEENSRLAECDSKVAWNLAKNAQCWARD